ncbi:hypothetical protein, conserved [Leishmania lindenbergi]|uniref:ALIX V-shaped domain-containing protein n=1 Tax=Leishmania lindenbergi TaxID=651832 RepID=A0AAW3AAJ7_9TRYP
MRNSKVRPPPPPRRAPPGPAFIKMSSNTHIFSHTLLHLSGVALLSQQLLQVKDSVNDIKVAIVTADDSLKAISVNPAVWPSSLCDGATTGGDDVQSLAFASVTLSKLAEEEKAQDAFYASLSETATVRAEVQKGSRDATLQRYKQQVECQLASSVVNRSLPEQQQVLLNPYSTVRRKILSTSLTVSPFTNTPNATAESLYRPTSATKTNACRPPTSSVAPPQQSSSYSIPAGSEYNSPYPFTAEGTPSSVYARYGAMTTPQQPSQTPPPVRYGAYGYESLPQNGNAAGGVRYGQQQQHLRRYQQQSGRPHYQAL